MTTSWGGWRRAVKWALVVLAGFMSAYATASPQAPMAGAGSAPSNGAATFKSTFLVTDQSSSLSGEQVARLNQAFLCKQGTGAAAFTSVVLVASTGPEDIRVYAGRLRTNAAQVSPEIADSTIVVIATQDRQIRVDVPPSQRSVIGDSRAQALIEQIRPLLQKSDVFGAISELRLVLTPGCQAVTSSQPAQPGLPNGDLEAQQVSVRNVNSTDRISRALWALGSLFIAAFALRGVLKVGLRSIFGVAVTASLAGEVLSESKKSKPDFVDATTRGVLGGLVAATALILMWPLVAYEMAVVPFIERSDSADRTICCAQRHISSVHLIGDHGTWATVVSSDSLSYARLPEVIALFLPSLFLSSGSDEAYHLVNLKQGYFAEFEHRGAWSHIVSPAEGDERGMPPCGWVNPGSDCLLKRLPLASVGLHDLAQVPSNNSRSAAFLVPDADRTRPMQLELEGADAQAIHVELPDGVRRTLKPGRGASLSVLSPSGHAAAILYRKRDQGILAAFFGSASVRIDFVEVSSGTTLRSVEIARFANAKIVPSRNGRRWVIVQDNMLKVIDLS